jgi:hypothetical protein
LVKKKKKKDALREVMLEFDVTNLKKVFLPSTALEMQLKEAPEIYAEQDYGIRLMGAYEADKATFVPNSEQFVNVKDLPKGLEGDEISGKVVTRFHMVRVRLRARVQTPCVASIGVLIILDLAISVFAL